MGWPSILANQRTSFRIISLKWGSQSRAAGSQVSAVFKPHREKSNSTQGETGMKDRDSWCADTPRSNCPLNPALSCSLQGPMFPFWPSVSQLVLVTQSCLTRCDLIGLLPTRLLCPWILQARMWLGVVKRSSRSSQSRDRTWVSHVSCVGRRVLYY